MKRFIKSISVLLCLLFIVSLAQIAVSADTEEVLNQVVVSILSDNVFEEESIVSRRDNVLICVDENAEQNTMTIVDKKTFDDMTHSEKKEVREKCIEELKNKKNVLFLGNEEQLDMNQLYEILDLGNPIEFEYENSDALKELKSISFSYDENDQMCIDFYLNSMDIEKALPHIISQANIKKNDSETIEGSDGSLQLKKVFAGSGSPAIVKYNQTITYNNTYLMEVYYTVQAKRQGIGDKFTIWSTTQRLTTSPYNGNYGTQTKNTHLLIHTFNDNDEWLEEYLPDSTVNNNNSSTGVSFGYSKNGANASVSMTQGMSYADVQTSASFHRQQGKCDWNFSFSSGSNAAKNSYTVQPKTIMTNKLSRFYFKHGGEVSFTAKTGLFGIRQTYTYLIQTVQLHYADISTK